MFLGPGRWFSSSRCLVLIYSTAFVWRGPLHFNNRLQQAQQHLIPAPRPLVEERKSSGGRLGWGPPVCVETSLHSSMETAHVWGTPHCRGLQLPNGNPHLCGSRRIQSLPTSALMGSSPRERNYGNQTLEVDDCPGCYATIIIHQNRVGWRLGPRPMWLRCVSMRHCLKWVSLHTMLEAFHASSLAGGSPDGPKQEL